MTTTSEQFLEKQNQEFLAFRNALTVETDRGCALFAAAYLDKALSDLLRVSLVQDQNIDDDLFKGIRPLSSFSSRIVLTYYLGKISLECRRDLDMIRKIRNDFAHHASLISFDTQEMTNRCKTLSFSYHTKDGRPRAHFTAAVSGILALLHARTSNAVAPIALADDRPTEAKKAITRNRIGL
jgi:DNA-binding MltR family transcriptional regulator